MRNVKNLKCIITLKIRTNPYLISRASTGECEQRERQNFPRKVLKEENYKDRSRGVRGQNERDFS